MDRADAKRRSGRLVATAVTALLVTACGGEPGLEDTEGELRVLPNKVVFERGYVGHDVETTIRLVNTGRSELLVEVAIEGPFQTQAGPYLLRGGADETKTIRFTPGAPGEFEGLVRYTRAEQVIEVSIFGTAVIPEVCVSPGACFEAWFDPVSGGCVTRELAEGASCPTGNACLVDGICMNHECRGALLDCNDGNACTDDRCDPAVGCRNDPIVCPLPVELCQEAVCQPERGCVTRDRRDGTSCGDNSTCIARHYCVAGKCDSRSAEGLRCAAQCGGGICRDEVCIREQGVVVDAPLHVVSRPTPIREIVQLGPVADDGTLLWFASTADGTESSFSALARVGAGRYQERFLELPLSGPLGPAGAMIAGDMAVIALAGSSGSAWIEGRWLADGAVAFLWQLPFETVNALIADGPRKARVVASGAGRAGVLAVDSDGPGPLALLEGSIVASAGEPAAVADADGRLYLALDHEEAGRRLVSLYGDNTLRWSVDLAGDDGGPVAVANGLLVLSSGGVFDTADGRRRFDLELLAGTTPGGPVPAPIMGGAAGFAVQAGDDATAPSLVAFDPTTGAPFGTGDLLLPEIGGNPRWTAPLLTSRDNAVVALQQDPLGSGVLISGFVEYRPDGDLARACLVPGLGRLAGPPLLTDGQFVFAERFGTVKLYELRRGADPATWGWAGPRGGPAGGNREGR